MKSTDASYPGDLKTIGLTPLIYCENQPLFHVTRDVPCVTPWPWPPTSCSSPKA